MSRPPFRETGELSKKTKMGECTPACPVRVRRAGVQACKKLFFYPPKLAILLNQLCPCGCTGGGGTTIFWVLPDEATGAGPTCEVQAFCTGGSCRAGAGAASRVTEERAASRS